MSRFSKEQVSPKLVEYVEKELYPIYNTFDHGHDVNHIEAVISRAFDIASDVKETSDMCLSPDLVYAAAAMHDIGMKVEREHHSTHSREFVEQDNHLKKFFSEDEIKILGEAVEDHSTSRKAEPRSIYGKIVCDADKDLDVSTSLLRAYDFTMAHSPELSEDECRDNVFEHLNLKFGKNGLVRFWTGAEKQRKFAETMRTIADDRAKYDAIIDEVVENRNRNIVI